MAKKAIVKKQDIIDVRRSSIVPFFSNGKKVEKSNCKFCQLDFRDEAELKFNTLRENYSALLRWLKDEKNTNISINAIRNHIIYHYRGPERNKFISEYASDINKWVDHQEDKMGALKTRMAVLDREMIEIAAEGQDLDLEQRRKNAETVKKLADTLLIYQSKIEEFIEQTEPVTIIFNQLKVIINDEMESIGDVKTKKVLVNILEKLQSSVGDMVIEQKES